ncbi:MAG: alpha/beta hydrolase, partial [Betaproteobacteria bacterium]|nr:alpha/beta hydrolase [Betaproteobacteria bacterium]
MTKKNPYDSLVQCMPSHLDAITAKLQLDDAFLPGSNEPVATRASAILKLVKQRGAKGLAELWKALDEVLGRESPTKQTKTKRNAGKSLKITKVRCILVLAANPVDTERLRFDEEVKLIEDELSRGKHGSRYQVVTKLATSRDELSRLLLKYEPAIVHFTGHGSARGEIVLQSSNGLAETVPARALAALFKELKGAETVVLNACYSMEQATSLAEAVPQVIGMAHAIGDASALRFAAGFYRGLAAGKDYASAFRLGCIEIDLAELPDAVTPHFTTRQGDSVASSTGTERLPGNIAVESPQRTWRSLPAAGKAISQQDDAAPRLFPLWYGTNRRPVDPNDPARGYTGERDEQRVHYGRCEVSVPKSHKIGSIGSSWWKRIVTWNDDRLRLVKLVSLAELDFWRQAQEALAQCDAGERRALVFIHGFNVSFEDAALRAAQIGVDLKVPGIMAFYSWPSKGSVLGYSADEATIEASERQISAFLMRFAAESGAERVDVLAHSMGNRALLRSLQRIMHQAVQAGKMTFGQLLLAAPDIDAELFRELASVYGRLAQRTTLYVSAKDKALAASGIVHDHPRAGYTPPVTVLPEIDTIEVSNVDLTFLGHGYYAAARDLLHDMHELILHGSPPMSRLGLITTKTPTGEPYWKI